VPGHEAVGRIDALGDGVEGWKVGQRVGVAFLAGSCGHCESCRNGDLIGCVNQPYAGVHVDGGYAKMMIAKASGLMSVPDELRSVDAAPLLCAGLTTFSALRNCPARAGDLVAVLGIGGLGHLGVQYARHMGFEVVAIGRALTRPSSLRSSEPITTSTRRSPIRPKRCRRSAERPSSWQPHRAGRRSQPQ